MNPVCCCFSPSILWLYEEEDFWTPIRVRDFFLSWSIQNNCLSQTLASRFRSRSLVIWILKGTGRGQVVFACSAPLKLCIIQNFNRSYVIVNFYPIHIKVDHQLLEKTLFLCCYLFNWKFQSSCNTWALKLEIMMDGWQKSNTKLFLSSAYQNFLSLIPRKSFYMHGHFLPVFHQVIHIQNRLCWCYSFRQEKEFWRICRWAAYREQNQSILLECFILRVFILLRNKERAHGNVFLAWLPLSILQYKVAVFSLVFSGPLLNYRE